MAFQMNVKQWCLSLPSLLLYEGKESGSHYRTELSRRLTDVIQFRSALSGRVPRISVPLWFVVIEGAVLGRRWCRLSG